MGADQNLLSINRSIWDEDNAVFDLINEKINNKLYSDCRRGEDDSLVQQLASSYHSFLEQKGQDKRLALEIIDGFIKIGKFNAAEKMISALHHTIDDLNISRRYMKIALKAKNFDHCLLLAKKYPTDKFHARAGHEAAVKTRNYELIEYFQNTGLVEEKNFQLAGKSDVSENISIEDIKRSLQDKRWDSFVDLCWRADALGLDSYEFFSLAISLIPTEPFLSDRQCYFRQKFYENYNYDSCARSNYVEYLLKHKLYAKAYTLLVNEYFSGVFTKDVAYKLEFIRRSYFANKEVFHSKSPSETPYFIGEEVAKKNLFNNYNLSSLRIDNVSKDFKIKYSQNKAIETARGDELKVAVCVSGQLRNFSNNWSNIYENIVKPLKGDVFISTWDMESLGVPSVRALHRVIGREVTSLLPADLRQPASFKSYFPNAFEVISMKRDIAVDVNKLYKLTGAKKIMLSSNDLFENEFSNKKGMHFGGSLNQSKMFYHIASCNELRLDYEEKLLTNYDVVIRVRPDLDINIPDIESYARYVISHPETILTSYIHYDGCGDQMFIGRADVMGAVAEIWNNIKEEGRLRYHACLSGRPAEYLLGEQCFFLGLCVQEMFSEKSNFAEGVEVDSGELAKAILKDIKKKDACRADVEPFLKFFGLAS